MKEKLVASETKESINQDIMSIFQKLVVISEDLKQIKTQILLHSFSAERIMHNPLNYYIAEDKMMQLKVGLLILSKRKKMLHPVHNLDDIREIRLSSKHGGITNLFRLIFNNIDLKFINMFIFKCDLAEICGFDINDKKSNERFRNAFNHAKYELLNVKRHEENGK